MIDRLIIFYFLFFPWIFILIFFFPLFYFLNFFHPLRVYSGILYFLLFSLSEPVMYARGLLGCIIVPHQSFPPNSIYHYCSFPDDWSNLVRRVKKNDGDRQFFFWSWRTLCPHSSRIHFRQPVALSHLHFGDRSGSVALCSDPSIQFHLSRQATSRLLSLLSGIEI